MTAHADTTAFPIVWRDPADADLTWFRDAMHFPAPMTPLTAAFLRECLEPGIAAACSDARVAPPDAAAHRVQRVGLQQPGAGGGPRGNG